WITTPTSTCFWQWLPFLSTTTPASATRSGNATSTTMRI
ncbi:MAG: hypothetical protein AVDCRST_MAG56-7356, partial [uncultured Cytophagales bacterium]